MARYAELFDCTDPVVTVEEADLERADGLVARLCTAKGIDPLDTGISAAGLVLLRDLAVAEAIAAAARRGAVEGDSPLWAKHKAWQAEAIRLGQQVDRETLGLAAAGSGSAGYGSITLGRG